MKGTAQWTMAIQCIGLIYHSLKSYIEKVWIVNLIDTIFFLFLCIIYVAWISVFTNMFNYAASNPLLNSQCNMRVIACKLILSYFIINMIMAESRKGRLFNKNTGFCKIEIMMY